MRQCHKHVMSRIEWAKLSETCERYSNVHYLCIYVNKSMFLMYVSISKLKITFGNELT